MTFLGTPPLAALNYIEIIRTGSLVELSVLALLACASAYSWAVIAVKLRQLSRARQQSLAFLDIFWKASRLDSIYQTAQTLGSSPLSKVFCAGYEELSRLAHPRTLKKVRWQS